jgi:hypothetical protein
MKRALLIFVASCAWSQSGIEVPSVGIIVDSLGSLRAVQGVAGNFLLGPTIAMGVLSAACSDQLCLAKTDSKILSATGQVDAPPGPSVFGLDRDTAVVFFPQSQTFARWRENTLEPLDWTVDSNVDVEVLSIRIAGDKIEFALRRDWAGVTNGPVLLLKEGVLFATADELVFRHGDGSEARFNLASAETITSMGSHYAAIHSGSLTYLLRLEPGHEQLFLLPGSVP